MANEKTEIEELNEKYLHLVHAMQTGVAFEQSHGSVDGTPKHLRVGVNSIAVNDAALVRLLMEKGLFTEAEYLRAVVDEMQREVNRYTERINATLDSGQRITLG